MPALTEKMFSLSHPDVARFGTNLPMPVRYFGVQACHVAKKKKPNTSVIL
jgi:hypothetical protein